VNTFNHAVFIPNSKSKSFTRPWSSHENKLINSVSISSTRNSTIYLETHSCPRSIPKGLSIQSVIAAARSTFFCDKLCLVLVDNANPGKGQIGGISVPFLFPLNFNQRRNILVGQSWNRISCSRELQANVKCNMFTETFAKCIQLALWYHTQYFPAALRLPRRTAAKLGCWWN